MSQYKFRGLMVIGLLALCLGWVYFGSSNSGDFQVKPKSILSLVEIPDELKFKGDAESENPLKRIKEELEMLKDPTTGLIPFNIRGKELLFSEQIEELNDNFFNIRSAVNGVSHSNARDFASYGPFNIGGRTRALGIDLSNESNLLAGGVSGGMWRSTNAGESWSRTTSPGLVQSITTLVQDERNGKTQNWYFGTGEFFGNSASASGAFYLGDGLYRSTDNGQSWNVIPGTTIGNNVNLGRYGLVNRLAIDISNTNQTEIYVASLGQIIRTVDDFATTEDVLGVGEVDGANQNFTDVAVSPTGVVVASISNNSRTSAGSPEGIFISNDGVSWSKLTPPSSFPTVFSRVVLSFDKTDENFVYALGTTFLFKYDRSADTWTDFTDGLDVSDDSGEGFNAQGGYNVVVESHPTDPNTVFVGGTNLTRSSNGFTSKETNKNIGGYLEDGDSESFPTYLNHHPDLHVVTFPKSTPNSIFTGSDGGVHFSSDNLANTGNAPVTWTSLNNGYVTSQFFAIDYPRNERGNPAIIGGMQDNGTWVTFSDDPIDDWVQAFGGDGSFAGITYNSLYVSSQEGQMFRYESDGSTFQQAGVISPSNDRDEFLFNNPFIYDRVNQDKLFVGAKGKIYFTDDIRENPGDGEWQQLAPVAISGIFVTALASSVQPEGVLYFGARSGVIHKVADTRNFNDVTNVSGTNFPSGTISSIAVDPRDADRVFVTFSNYGVVSIWLSENGGGSWASIAGNLEENTDGSGTGPSVRSIEILPNGAGELVFVGTSTGLYMASSLAGNQTVWVKQAEDIIGSAVVNMIKVRPIDGEVVVATHGNGVFVASYDVGFHTEINYSITSESSAVLRADISFTSGAGFSYRWSKDNVEIPSSNNSELTVSESGTYKAEVFDQLGPAAFTNEVILTFDVVAAIDSPFEVTSTVKPNPSAGVFTINLGADFAKGFTYKVVDSNGNQIAVGEQSVFGSNIPFTIDLTNKPDGLYILNVSNDLRAETLKLLKQSR
jgi:hypothetical protein